MSENNGFEPGKLVQYKIRFYGLYYKTLPKIPFSREYDACRIEDTRTLLNVFLKGNMTELIKKYTLLINKVDVVSHPRIKSPLASCEYLNCFITSPSGGDVKMGWVRSDWVEPITGSWSYNEDLMNELRAKLKELNQK